ncbi:hypothetical protein [Nocardioides nanhaiensis]|uniref:Uncharacterized protein n=1 Tax=Nocardioides nanhaiensis TaxID=1476871 RepID=A0ABP8WAE5_9ACTN
MLRSPHPRRRGALVLALVPAVATALLTACSPQEETGPRTVEAGEVVVARQLEVESTGRTPFLVVPTGRLEVRAGEPTAQVEGDATRAREAVVAPEGSVLVPLTWRYLTDVLDAAASVFGAPQELGVTLVAEGERYPLVPPAEDRSASDEDEFYVAVAGDGQDLELELAYAGVTQTLDLRTGERESGVAQGLYPLQGFEVRTRECPDRDWAPDDAPLGQLYFYCTVTNPLVTPFRQGAWAEEGTSFAVVGVTSTLEGYLLPGADGLSSATYAVASSRSTTRLGGERPLEVDTAERGPATVTDFLTFEVRGRVPGQISVGRRIELTRELARGVIDAPDTLSVEARGDVALP